MSIKKRDFVFTWNNYPPDYATTLDAIISSYLVAGEEVAPVTQTPHLQGYVRFGSPLRVSAARAKLPGCHVEIARGSPQQCDTYCRKSAGTIYCRGTLPISQQAKGDLEKKRWDEAWENAKKGNLEEIPADIRIRQYSSLRRIERDYMPPVARLNGPCGIWIVGKAGAGKTRSVLDQFPEAYPKPRTKWWDGYQGEDVVYLDDIDKFNVALGGELKLWADAYPFIAENKGGSKKIRPKRFIVTSQYRIEEIWEDQATREALLRRFVVVEKIIGNEIVI